MILSNPCTVSRRVVPTKDASASLRLPAALKQEVERIAKAEGRTKSSALELLIARGVEAYSQDGVLKPGVTRRRRPKKVFIAGTQEFARGLAEQIMEAVRVKNAELGEAPHERIQRRKHPSSSRKKR